jgi:hypothetical protein
MTGQRTALPLCALLLAACGGGDPDITPDGEGDSDLAVDCVLDHEPICDDYVGLATPAEIASTPREDPEAEYLALMLTDGIVAEQAAYDRIRSDIASIRASEPRVALIEPYHMHDGKSLYVFAEEDVVSRMRRGDFHAWDCMNDLYVLEDSICDDWCVLTLKGYYDLGQLAEEYHSLPCVANAHGPIIMGDGNRICVSQEGVTYHYVFDEASGDCPSGCTIHDYYHFTSEPGSDPVLVDEIHVDWDEAPPDWVIENCYR